MLFNQLLCHLLSWNMINRPGMNLSLMKEETPLSLHFRLVQHKLQMYGVIKSITSYRSAYIIDIIFLDLDDLKLWNEPMAYFILLCITTYLASS